MNSRFTKAAAIISLFTASTMCSGCGDNSTASNVEMLGTNGLYFDSADRLFVASADAGMVFVVDPETGTTLQTIGSDQGIHSPDDLYVGSNGTAYVTNYFEGTVVAVSEDGGFRELAQLGQGVNPITMDEHGKLWVGRGFPGDALYSIDPDAGVLPELVAESLNWLNAMDFGDDGMLYGPVSNGAVIRVDPSNGSFETIVAGFESTPHALKFDRQGQMYVVEGNPGRVLLVDRDDGSIEEIARYEPGLDNLAFDSLNRLFISSYIDGSLHEVLENGTLRQLRAPSQAAGWAHRLTLMRVMFPLVAVPVLVAVALFLGWRYFRRRHRLNSKRG